MKLLSLIKAISLVEHMRDFSLEQPKGALLTDCILYKLSVLLRIYHSGKRT